MPIIRRGDVPVEELAGNQSQPLARANLGAASVTVSEVTIPPGGQINLHIHPGHEECILIKEGALQARLGDDESTVTTGDTIIAPDSVKHSLTNISGSPATIIAIFPTTDVQREWLDQ
jgi:quercetin dioxygenase-like cupin family protein